MWRENEQRSRIAEVQLFNCMLDWLLLLFGTIPPWELFGEVRFRSLFSCQGYRSCLVTCCWTGSGDLCSNLLMRLYCITLRHELSAGEMQNICMTAVRTLGSIISTFRKNLCVRRQKLLLSTDYVKIPLSKAVTPSLYHLNSWGRTATVLALRPHTD